MKDEGRMMNEETSKRSHPARYLPTDEKCQRIFRRKFFTSVGTFHPLAKRMRVEPENLIIQIMKRDNNSVVCMDNNTAPGDFVF